MSNDITLPHPATLLAPVLNAVFAAGALLRAEFHRPGGPRGKSGKAPVDAEIEAFLRLKLTDLHDCDWHGEELPRHRSGHRDCWVVDPQDGTSAFLGGHRGSSISVAVLREGRPILGVVFAPTAPDDGGDAFYWAEGLAPMRNGTALAPIGPRPAPYEPFDGIPWPAAPAEVRPYDHATLLAMNETAGDYAAHNHALFTPAGVLAVPSIAYRLALAAAGDVDAALSLTLGLDSYDLAGAQALLSAVGGILVEIDGSPVDHACGRSFAGCVGGRPEIVQEVVRRRPRPGPAVARNPVRSPRRTPSIDQLRRAQGALLGLLAGDALGSHVEFQSGTEIARRFPDGLCDLRAGGTWNLLAGQPTDDGELALSLARSLIARRGFDGEHVARSYIEWKGSNPFDIGSTTMRGIDALRDRGRADRGSQSNGALMRVAPIGIAAAGDPETAATWARQDAALTHPHPVCLAASAAFAAAVAAGIAGADCMAAWSAAYAHAGEDSGGEEVRACLVEARDAPPPDFQRNQGWVLTALGNAFHRLWTGQAPAQAIIDTVAKGGDTDTNAAICGALLGSVHGCTTLPRRWRVQVSACRAVRGKGVTHPRPSPYWADDAGELAEALLALSSKPFGDDRMDGRA